MTEYSVSVAETAGFADAVTPAMSVTVRERIIRAVGARLAGVTIANGYATDIGGNVHRAVRHHDPGGLPAAVIWPQPEEVTRKVGGKVHLKLPIRVEGLAEYGAANPSVVSERILGDLVRIMTSRASIAAVTAGLADDVEYAGGGTDEYPDEETQTVGASALFHITYRILSGDPFEQ